MKKIELIVIQKDELQELIIDSLNACLKFHLPKQEEKKQLPEWLSREQVAEYLSCTVQMVDNWANEGLLKEYHINKLLRFKREEVRKAIEEK